MLCKSSHTKHSGLSTDLWVTANADTKTISVYLRVPHTVENGVKSGLLLRLEFHLIKVSENLYSLSCSVTHLERDEQDEGPRPSLIWNEKNRTVTLALDE